MKKLLFSALASVAFAGSGFASNEVVIEKQDLKTDITNSEFSLEEFAPCQVEFWVYDADGGFLDYVHKLTDTETIGGCYQFAGQLMDDYIAEHPGSTISNVEIIY